MMKKWIAISLIHLPIGPIGLIVSDAKVCMCTKSIAYNHARLALPFLNTKEACLKLTPFKI